MSNTSSNRSKWEFRCGLYQKHLDLYLDRMAYHLKQSGTSNVLDAGCGEGYVYRAMRKRGYAGTWTGFDFSDEAIEFAKRESPESAWRCASAYEIPFAAKSFDLVFSSEVLEHLEKPDAALKEYARVSSHRLLLSVPLEPYFQTLAWLSVTLHIGGDPGHVNHWNAGAFRQFAAHAGTVEAWERTTIYQIAMVNVNEVSA